MERKAMRYLRFWELYQRKLLSSMEIVNPFVEELDASNIDQEWNSLPEGYRKVVRKCLRTIDWDQMPPVFRIGPSSSEGIEQMTRTRDENVKELAEFFKRNVGAGQSPGE